MLQTRNIQHKPRLEHSITYSLKSALAVLTTSLLLLASSPANAQQDLVWNPLPADRAVYLELEEGTVVIELNPEFAPKMVEHLKSLMEDQYYRGRSFYRVIDGFMAQAGADPDTPVDPDLPTIKAEFEIQWPSKPSKQSKKQKAKNPDAVNDNTTIEAAEIAEEWTEMPWTAVQENDLYAPYTGFVNGFAVGRDQKKAGKAWLLHCPGSVALARGNEPDSGYADFYIVMGQAPRYLDRNMTVFGRVVWGMDVVQRIKRGSALENGMIDGDLDRTWIKRMRLASSVDKDQQLNIWIADTNDKSFVKMLKQRRDRKQPFFHYRPPKVLDVCQVPVASRLEKPDAEILIKFRK